MASRTDLTHEKATKRVLAHMVRVSVDAWLVPPRSFRAVWVEIFLSQKN